MKQILIILTIISILLVSGCITIPAQQENKVLSEKLIDDKDNEKVIVKESEEKVSVRETPDFIISDSNPSSIELKPVGKYHKSTKGGYTLIIDDFTFTKKTETYGKLDDLTFILKNEQGSDVLFPEMVVYINDKVDKTLNINQEIGLSEWIQDGDSIKRKVVIDLGIASINNPKEFKVALKDYLRVINSVVFDVNLSESTKLG